MSYDLKGPKWCTASRVQYTFTASDPHYDHAPVTKANIERNSVSLGPSKFTNGKQVRRITSLK